SDEIPTYKRYETASNNAVQIWTDSRITGNEVFTTAGTSSNIPVQRLEDGEVSTTVNRSAITNGTIYIHSKHAEKTGLMIDSGGVTLGSREYAFVYLPNSNSNDNTVYSNGVGEVFIKKAD
ncbi:hypothetical protein, partial [Halorubrum sp. SP9]